MNETQRFLSFKSILQFLTKYNLPFAILSLWNDQKKLPMWFWLYISEGYIYMLYLQLMFNKNFQ